MNFFAEDYSNLEMIDSIESVKNEYLCAPFVFAFPIDFKSMSSFETGVTSWTGHVGKLGGTGGTPLSVTSSKIAWPSIK